MLSSSIITPGQSYAAVLRRGHQQQPHTEELTSVLQPTGQQPGQSVQACNVKKSNLDTMFKVASVVQQIMTEIVVLCLKKQK
jgi:hypothetical protein